jgi:glycerol-3-phosphate dehydrogenase (NAD(P)+)
MLITRANAEISRITAIFGGRPETSQTLAGIGDLMLTCSSAQSRNTSLGIAIAEGKNLEAILKERTNVTEGVATSKAAFELIKEHNIYAPIITAVYEIIYQKKPIDAVVEALLSSQQELELA